jgi:serine/threonine protein kinase
MQIIRTFLQCTPDQLGVVSALPVCAGLRSDYELQRILGRGAFCTAFLALQRPQGNMVVIKRKCLATDTPSADPNRLLAVECSVLRKFTSGAPECEYLPKLAEPAWMFTAAVPYVPNWMIAAVMPYVPFWMVTAGLPYIPMLPVGQQLERRYADLTAAQRGCEARVLYRHVVAGLHAAHNLGVCHQDVRPQNVVYNVETQCYVLIDWGLAAAPGQPMHPHRGGRPFWHDDVVKARKLFAAWNFPYFPEHDVAAARYVAWAFQAQHNLRVSWENVGDVVTARKKEVGDFLIPDAAT